MNIIARNTGGGYFTDINIVRGMTLLLVLFGHSFPDGDTGMSVFAAEWIRTFLYTFHMGIFFILSGFVACERLTSGEYSCANQIKKKFMRLLIPYFFYSFITIAPKQIFSSYVNNPFDVSDIWMIFIGKSPNGAMWFLYCLFLIQIIYILLFKLLRKSKYKLSLCLLISVLLYGIQMMYPSLLDQTFFKYSIFFMIGMLIKKNYDKFYHGSQWYFGVVALMLVWLIAYPIWTIKIDYLITGLLGFYGIYSLGKEIDLRDNLINRLFDYLGRNSYAIYLLSYLIQIPIRMIMYSYLKLPYWVCVSLMFVFGLIGSVVMEKIIKKSKILSIVMLGEKANIS